MPEPRAQRTLVKSPPELWAEVSDAASLARHLGEFGEIRITKLEPESIVAWEGDRARGTVELEASGWGTKVTLSAEVLGEEPAVAEEPIVAMEPITAVEPIVAEEPIVERPEPVVFEPVAVEGNKEDEPDVAAVTAPAPPARRPGLWARLFARKHPPAELPRRSGTQTRANDDEPEVPGPAGAPEPGPAPGIAPLIAELEAVVPPPAVAEDRAPELAPQPAPAPEPPPEPEPEPEPPPAARLDEARAEAVLVEVLDTLGSAHHRPFSRG